MPCGYNAVDIHRVAHHVPGLAGDGASHLPAGPVITGAPVTKDEPPLMFTHFAPAAKASVDAATAIAHSLHHDYLGVPHLVLGLLQTDPDLFTGVYTPAEGATPAPTAEALSTALKAALGTGTTAADARLNATGGAVAAVKQADVLMTERHDGAVLPLHLLVAVLEQVQADPALAGQIAAAGVD